MNNWPAGKEKWITIKKLAKEERMKDCGKIRLGDKFHLEDLIYTINKYILSPSLGAFIYFLFFLVVIIIIIIVNCQNTRII